MSPDQPEPAAPDSEEQTETTPESTIPPTMTEDHEAESNHAVAIPMDPDPVAGESDHSPEPEETAADLAASSDAREIAPEPASVVVEPDPEPVAEPEPEPAVAAPEPEPVATAPGTRFVKEPEMTEEPHTAVAATAITAMNEGVPPAGEDIHLPPGSIIPVAIAFSLTLILIGTTVNWLWTILGGILFAVCLGYWIRDTRREVAHLPDELGSAGHH